MILFVFLPLQVIYCFPNNLVNTFDSFSFQHKIMFMFCIFIHEYNYIVNMYLSIIYIYIYQNTIYVYICNMKYVIVYKIIYHSYLGLLILLRE